MAYPGLTVNPLKGSMTDDDNEGDLANLSQLAYEPDVYQKLRTARELGYDYDTDLSTYNQSVFRHRGTKQTVLAFRGTNPMNMDDLAADLHIAMGSRGHNRFREAEQIAKKVEAKYGKDFTVTGHSLGGTLALHVNQLHGNATKVFNPGSSPLFERDYENTPGHAPIIVRNGSDLVSYGHKNKKNVKTVKGAMTSMMESALNQTPIGFLYNQLRAHNMAQFKR